MNVHLALCKVSSFLIILGSGTAWVPTARAQPSEGAVIEILIKKEPPIRIVFNPDELGRVERDPMVVRTKLEAASRSKYPDPRQIDDGVWACRDGTTVRTKNKVLKTALMRLFR